MNKNIPSFIYYKMKLFTMQREKKRWRSQRRGFAAASTRFVQVRADKLGTPARALCTPVRPTTQFRDVRDISATSGDIYCIDYTFVIERKTNFRPLRLRAQK